MSRPPIELTSESSPVPAAPPVSGAWQPGDPVGDRRFHRVKGGRRFQLEGGGALQQAELAYETWGELSPAADNAVLVCHALTGDSHAAGRSGDGHTSAGWWDPMIGPGRCFDTDRYFVVCANVLGGCQGSTGPASRVPGADRRYGSSFPVVSVRDMVRTQASLADELGVRRWRSVVGGSMGGMQALEWAIMYPERVGSAVLLASTAQASAQQIAWSHIGRAAIESDPDFRGGDYYDVEARGGQGPHRGLTVARMIAQVTYRSDELFSERFGRTMLRPMDFSLGRLFDVEGYLDYQGQKLVRRFDANSYLRLNRAMDLHDVGRGRGGVRAALARVAAPTLVGSVRSDALYPPDQQMRIRDGLEHAGVHTEWLEIDSPHGHDGFLIETAQMAPRITEFLQETT